MKQAVIVANRTGAIKLTLWRGMIGALKIEKCYSLNQMNVRVYDCVKSLTYLSEGGSHFNIGGCTEGAH